MGLKRVLSKLPLTTYTNRIREETREQHQVASDQQQHALPMAATLSDLFTKNHISELTRRSLFGS